MTVRNRILARALAECRRNPVDPPLLDWTDFLAAVFIVLMVTGIVIAVDAVIWHGAML